jgi:hypothetical protein
MDVRPKEIQPEIRVEIKDQYLVSGDSFPNRVFLDSAMVAEMKAENDRG